MLLTVCVDKLFQLILSLSFLLGSWIFQSSQVNNEIIRIEVKFCYTIYPIVKFIEKYLFFTLSKNFSLKLILHS